MATVALSFAIFAAAGCGQDDRLSSVMPTPAPPTVMASSLATAIPSSTAAPPTTPVPRRITGLFTEPREVRSDATQIVPAALSRFNAWDGKATVIYDTLAATETNLGPGSNVSFDISSREAVWVAGDEALTNGVAMLLDIKSGMTRSLGPARLARFTGPGIVLIIEPGLNTGWTVNLKTGDRMAAQLASEPQAMPAPHHLVSVADAGPELERGGRAGRTWELRDTATGVAVLRFDAFATALARDGTLAVATIPSGGLTNIFLVDIATATARYVATAVSSLNNWPFGADEKRIVWTDNYCGTEQGEAGATRVFDRKSGRVVALANPDGSQFAVWFRLLANGLLQTGAFNGGKLLDLDTWTYRAVVPGNHVNWSPDYRYAAHGQFGGHGGLC